MSISPIDVSHARASLVEVRDDGLVVTLADGRSLTIPLGWFPRLLHGSAKERANWRLVGDGEGIHWPDLDEDISVGGLLAGHRSIESEASLGRWLATRRSNL
jgi:hypothetical protein